MSGFPFTPWLGLCHYQQAETVSSAVESHADANTVGDNTATTILSEYQALVAVWANNHITYSNTLSQRLSAQGKTLLWAEDALPVEQWLEQHGTNATAINLAKAINDAHKLQLGPATALGADGTLDDDQDYLIIEEIEGVEPLDDQFGVYPKKTVPDKLYEPLFGQPEPTPEEIEAAGGDANNVPSMKLYAILDAAKVTNLPELLESSKLHYECLFKGQAYEELKTVAPYIVELEEGNDFTRHLFSQPRQDDGQPITDPTHSDNVPWFLWNKEPGIYIRSRAVLQELQHHFRKFTKTKMQEDGRQVLFKFNNPYVLSGYLRNIRKNATKTRCFCTNERGICIQFILITKNTNIFYAIPNMKKLITVSRPQFLLSYTDFLLTAQIVKQQRATRIAERIKQDFSTELAQQSLEVLTTFSLKIINRFNRYGFTKQEYIHHFVAWSVFFGEGFEDLPSHKILKAICNSKASEDERFLSFKIQFDHFSVRQTGAI